MRSVSVENAGSVQGLSSYQLTPFDGHRRHRFSLGSRKFKATYNKALSLEQKTTSGLNTLVEKLSSWVTDIDGRVLPDGALQDVISVERARELWEKERHHVRVALAILKNEPVPRLASTRPRSFMKQWLMNLVHFT
jgi:hypothetical protein